MKNYKARKTSYQYMMYRNSLYTGSLWVDEDTLLPHHHPHIEYTCTQTHIRKEISLWTAAARGSLHFAILLLGDSIVFYYFTFFKNSQYFN